MKKIGILFVAIIVLLSGFTACSTEDDKDGSSEITSSEASGKESSSKEASSKASTPKPKATATTKPTAKPAPTAKPTTKPTVKPKSTVAPTKAPTAVPTAKPTAPPTQAPTPLPEPTAPPTQAPTPEPNPYDYVGSDIYAFFGVFGSPNSSYYAPGCSGYAEDGEHYYNNYTVYTHRDDGYEFIYLIG